MLVKASRTCESYGLSDAESREYVPKMHPCAWLVLKFQPIEAESKSELYAEVTTPEKKT